MDEATKLKQYQALRSKLQNDKYFQPMHPDSMALVSRLYKDNKRASIQYQNLLKKFSQNNSQMSNNSSYVSRSDDQINTEYKLNLLNKQYCDVKQKLRLKEIEVEELRNSGDNDDRIQRIREKYDNSINQFLNKIQNYEKMQSHAASEKRRLEESVNSLSRELDNVKEELESKQRTLLNETKERINIRNQYDNVLNSTYSIDNKRIEEMSAIIDRKSIRIEQLEKELKSNANKILDSKSQIEEKEIERKNMIRENKNLNCLVDSLKSQIIDLNSESSKTKSKIEQLLKQIDDSKKQRISLQKQLQEMKSSEIQKTYSNEARDSAKEKLNNLYEQTYKKLEQKIFQCETMEGEKQTLNNIVQTLQSKVRQASNKNIVLNKNIGNLQHQYDLISNKYSQKLKQYHELNIQKQHFERAGKEMEPLKMKYIQLEAKYNQVLISGSASSDMSSKGKIEFEHEIRVLKEEISFLKQRVSQRQITHEKQINQLQRARMYINNGSKQIQTLNSQKEAFMKQNNQLKQKVDELQSKMSNTKTSDLKKAQKIRSDEIIICDVRNKLQEESDKVRTLLDENKLLETKLRKIEEKNKQLYQDNVQLKDMYQKADEHKNQLLGKLKRSTSQRNFMETEKSKQSMEISEMKRKMQHYEEKLEQKERAILQINNLRDDQQLQLNKTLQENFDLQERVKKLENDLRQYDQSLGENQYSLTGLQGQVKSLQTQNHSLIRKCQKLEGDIRNAKTTLNRYQSDIQRQNNQIALLVANNKDLSKQITAYESALASLTNTVEQRTRQLDQSRTNSQMSRIESEQLQQECLDNATQRKRLNELVKEMEQQNHRMYDICQIRDHQIQQLGQILNSSQYKEAQYIAEINNYEKKLSLLTNEVNLKDEDFRRASMERDFLKSQVSSSRRDANIDWKALMEERLHHTQCELNLKKRQIEAQSLENQKLNIALQNQRVVNYKLSKQIEEMKFGSHLNTPIRNLICQSLQNSQVENSSLHSNQGGETFRQRESGGLTSFESENSFRSKDVISNYEKIKEKYTLKVTGASGKGMKKI